MNPCEWHWARLKRDVRIDDLTLLNWIKKDSFIVCKNTIVWARIVKLHNKNRRAILLTAGPETINIQRAAYQAVYNARYSDLLEPLE